MLSFSNSQFYNVSRLRTLLFVLLTFATMVAQAEQLTLFTESSYPLNYRDNDGNFTGPAVDVVKEIQKSIGDHSPIIMQPWARAYSSATSPKNSNVALFATTWTEARHDKFHWVGPIAQVTWVLYAKSELNISIDSLEDAKKVAAIGTYRGDAREKFLLDNGFNNLYSTTSSSQSLKMLLKGRITLWASSLRNARELTDQANTDYNLIRPVYTVKTNGLYIAFHKNTDKKIIEQWQQGYNNIRENGMLKRISESYQRPFPLHKIQQPIN